MGRAVEDAGLRQSILTTARRLLVREGYRGLSMRKLAREIGYSATSIYLHFRDKDALFHALIEEGMDRLNARLVRAAREAGEGPVERLTALAGAYVDFALEEQEYYEIMFSLQPDHLERFPRDKYRRARRNLELMIETVQRGQAEGLFIAGDPDVVASVVWAQLHGMVSLLSARRLDADADVSQLLSATLAAVKRTLLLASPSEETAGSSQLVLDNLHL